MFCRGEKYRDHPKRAEAGTVSPRRGDLQARRLTSLSVTQSTSRAGTELWNSSCTVLRTRRTPNMAFYGDNLWNYYDHVDSMWSHVNETLQGWLAGGRGQREENGAGDKGPAPWNVVCASSELLVPLCQPATNTSHSRWWKQVHSSSPINGDLNALHF